MGVKTVFKRRELKFLSTEEQSKELLEFMGDRIVPDKWGKSAVQSLYYDTESFALIRRSLERPLYKEKFRVRCYGILNGDSTVFAEIKKKYRSVVYKQRIIMDKQGFESFAASGPKEGETVTEKEISFFFKRYDRLAPKMLISCAREAYFDKTDSGLRITFDRDIRYRNYDLALDKGIYGKPILPENVVLMEVKVDNALPLWVCKMLSERKIYKQSFSKYGMAYIDNLKLNGSMEK